MSYLSLPRLIFSGQFQIDRLPVGIETNQFSNCSLPETPLDKPLIGLCNLDSGSSFRLKKLMVKSAQTTTGSAVSDTATDYFLMPQSQSAMATLIKLDPEVESGPAIWGLSIVLTDGKQEFMRADYLPASARDVVAARTEKDTVTKFTSVLTNVCWPADTGSSDVLAELRRSAQSNGNKLSINMMTYDYSAANFIGNVVGSIGAWSQGQPERFVLGRRFAVAATAQTETPEGVGFFDAEVNDQVSLDLGNALPFKRDSGDFSDLDPISVVVLKTADEVAGVPDSLESVNAGISQNQEIDNTEFELLGDVAYRDKDWLTTTAGIADIAIPAAAKDLVNHRPLALVSPATTPGKFKVLIRETVGGLFVRADQIEFRVDTLAKKDVIVDATLYTSKYGKPVSGYTVDLASFEGDNPGVAAKSGVGTSVGVLAFSEQVVTGDDGSVSFPVRVSNPGQPRHTVDGQIYRIHYNFSADGLSPIPLMDTFTFHIRGAYIPPDKPSWGDHIDPIMKQYGALYNTMRDALFGNTDLQIIEKHARLLKFAFERPQADPEHLPATRDLSSGKRQTVLAFLDQHIPGKKSPVISALSKHRIADSDALDRIPRISSVLLSVASAQE